MFLLSGCNLLTFKAKSYQVYIFSSRGKKKNNYFSKANIILFGNAFNNVVSNEARINQSYIYIPKSNQNERFRTLYWNLVGLYLFIWYFWAESGLFPEMPNIDMIKHHSIHIPYNMWWYISGIYCYQLHVTCKFYLLMFGTVSKSCFSLTISATL